jgi:hypothetical protein
MYSSPKIYPIRTNANSWKIPLYSKHICSSDCQIAIIEDSIDADTNVVYFIENPEYKDGKCSFYEKINLSMINLYTFDSDSLKTTDGVLVYENQIVIPDNEIYVQISFPLKIIRKILIKSKNSLGFSLTDILIYIKNIYKWVYSEEEKTCSLQTHNIFYNCDCTTIPNTEKLKKSRDENVNNRDVEDKVCSICLETANTPCSDTNETKEPIDNFSLTQQNEIKVAKTLCNHIFHTNCIDQWLENNKKCPLCRADLMKCELCEGKEVLCREYVGKVIPKSMRGTMTYRNYTDGIFGIYHYDFEDLYIENLFYNKLTKTIYPKIIYS